MRPTIIFYPNKAKKSKKNGKHPLYMRVLFNDQKTEARLAAELTDLEVELWDPTIMRLRQRDSAINQYLSNLETKYHEFRSLNATQLPAFSAVMIKDYILGTSLNKKETVMDFVHDYFKASVYIPPP